MKKLLYLLIAIGSLTYLESCKEDDPCEEVTCSNGGSCVDGDCICPDGFSGTTCQTEDLCITKEVVCENDGTCEDGDCKCKSDYYGETCADRCVRGEYEDGDCECEQGIEGDACETPSRRKFCGVYTLTSTLSGSSGSNLTCTIDSSRFEDTDVWKVEITNLSSKNDANGYAEVDGNKISVPQQTVKDIEGTKWQVTSVGSGTLTASGFTLKMTRKNLEVTGATAQEGTYTYTK